MVHDFLFSQTGRISHLCDAPLGSTSAIPGADMIISLP